MEKQLINFMTYFMNKFKKCPHIIWVNKNENNKLENTFKKYKLKYTKLRNCDNEEAIKYFTEQTKYKKVIICNDAISFDFVKLWNKNILNYLNRKKKYSNLILAPIRNKNFNIKWDKYREENFYKNICYLITRGCENKDSYEFPLFAVNEQYVDENHKKIVKISNENFTEKWRETNPKFIYINLSSSTDRKEHMEKIFKENNIEKYKRIDAYNGRGNKFNDFCYVSKHFGFGGGNYGCFCSHLKCLKYFVENIKREWIIIMEDDVSFEYKKYWKKSFDDYVKDCPFEWDVLNLSIITKKNINKIDYYKYDVNINGASSYAIKKDYAKKILSNISIKDGKYDFTDFKSKSQIKADDAIYSFSDKIYYIPILTYVCKDSLFHQSHLHKHHASKDKITKLWQNSCK